MLSISLGYRCRYYFPLLYLLQDTHGAVPYYNRSIELDPNNVNALCSFGVVLKLKLGKAEEVHMNIF